MESEHFIRSCWGYDCFLSGKDTNKNGVAVLFNNNFEHKVRNVIRDPEGCYIVIDIEVREKRITLVNLYGSSSKDNFQFFDDLFHMVENVGNEDIIMGGDWNVVLNPKLDARNYNSYSNRPRSRNKIVEMMGDLQLVDVWRHLFPDKRGYTWRRFNSVQQSRLDFFLVSDSLLIETSGVKVTPGYRSDHSLVSLELKGNVEKQR